MAKNSGYSEEAVAENVSAPGMDINRYLMKNQKDKGIGDMLKVMYRGKIKTEAEWETEIGAVINRRVS